MPAFHKALLLFNPVSGSRLHSREAAVRRVEAIFRSTGVEVTVEPTTAKGSAASQARAAIASGHDAIIACGGDGTVFDVLQGVAETSAMLGVIPFGTGNVLATDLGLTRNVEQAAQKLLTFTPQPIALGQIKSGQRCHYFTAAAGIGAHAELIYLANAEAKQRGGFLAYYHHGFRLLFQHDFVPFPIEITTTDGRLIRTNTLELVAMRVSSFGGPLSRWRPGGSLLSPDLRIVLMQRSRRTALFRYSLLAFAGLAPYAEFDPARTDGELSFLPAKSVACHLPEGRSAESLRVQADGEVLGGLPAEVSIVPNALNLLVPRSL